MVPKGLRYGGWSLAALAMSVNASCINFSPPPPPVSEEYSAEAPAEQWMLRTGRGITGPIAATGSLALVGSANRNLEAVSLATGESLWNRRLPGALMGGVLVRNSMLYAGTGRPDGRVDAIDFRGRRIWRARSGEVTAPLAAAADMIIALNREGDAVALNAATGRIRWRRAVGRARAPAIESEGAIVVTTLDSLFRLDFEAGRVQARRPTPGVVLGGWTPVGRILVAGVADTGVVAVDPRTLVTLWRVPSDAPVIGELAAQGDTIWAASRIGTIYRLVLGQGAPEVSTVARLQRSLTSGISRMGSLLLVGGADGRIHALSENGEEQWRVRVWPPADVTPVSVDGGVLAAGGDGDVHYFLGD
jgi:outer membrane protein assembly factor BamB